MREHAEHAIPGSPELYGPEGEWCCRGYAAFALEGCSCEHGRRERERRGIVPVGGQWHRELPF